MLECPSCGGKLDVNNTTSILICIHCGSEHLVRRAGSAVTLESFARCPMCGRNDRVEKVSAIYNYQSGAPLLISRLKPPDIKATSRLQPLPIPELELPGKPEPQEIPDKPQQNILMIISYLVLTLFMVGLIIAILMSTVRDYKIVAIIFVIWFSVVLAVIFDIPTDLIEIINTQKFRYNYDQHVLDLNKQNADALFEWETEIQDRKEKHQKKKESLEKQNSRREELKTRLERAYQRWENLYYCHRDDSVFLPGEYKFVPVEKMKDLLLEN